MQFYKTAGSAAFKTQPKLFNVYQKYFKSIIDFIAAFLLLLLLSPLLVSVTIGLFIANQGSPFFLQPRPGKDERLFQIIKFKTMNDRRDAQGALLPDQERITWIGGIIRKLSIDELPQLINILKGDMSFVGPRPLLYKYLPLYSAEQRRRHAVKPGITGLAQVNGRNSISWTEKFRYDIQYVDQLSLGLDLRILWLTLGKVIKKEGVNQTLSRPMQPFNGNN
jgi:undecaprenyl phosphate N,N'-diacetylbacillosamine 1-phosphate transferase